MEGRLGEGGGSLMSLASAVPVGGLMLGTHGAVGLLCLGDGNVLLPHLRLHLSPVHGGGYDALLVHRLLHRHLHLEWREGY